MLKRITERFFSLFIHIFYKQIGTKIRTDAFKFFFDIFFVVFEKIGFKFDVISNNYVKLYDDIVEKEIRMAKISSNDHILVIGCGSLPATSALLAMKTTADITAIDTNQKSVREASLYFKNLNVGSQITVEHADGLHYPVNRFDFIFVLHGVQQQNKIFRYLGENMQDKTKIIFRTVCDENGKLSNNSLDLSRFFSVEGSVRSECLGAVDSLLLSKKVVKD